MRILNEKFAPAIDMIYRSISESDKFERRMVIAQLCRRAGRDMEAKKNLVDARRRYSKSDDPAAEDQLGLALTEILSVAGKKQIGEEVLAETDKNVLAINDDYIAAVTAYVLGEELFQRDQKQLAKKYFVRCLQSVSLSPAYATLAGAWLCELDESHKSRADDKAFVEGQRWPMG